MFLKRKCKTIVLPYLICSIPAIVICVVTGKFSPAYGDVGVMKGTVLNIITGAHSVVYWYIPFVMLIFLSSPLAISFTKLSHNRQSVLLFSLFIVSAFLHRSHYNANPIHSYIYFMPLFLFGVYCSIHRDKLKELRPYAVLFLIAALALAWTQINIFNHIGLYHKNFFEFGGVDLAYIQKLFLLIFIVLAIPAIEKKSIPFLDYFAIASFPLFFLHPYIMRLFDMTHFSLVFGYNAWPSMLSAFLYTTLVTSCSVIVLECFRKIFGEGCLYIIGDRKKSKLVSKRKDEVDFIIRKA
ncbi:Acyltransferase family protein [Desulfobacula phenolica]|uniref:Acyltransferase family protein n=2 Tax=Desulfobacula phenolica TaxID=90732 RepID=A0A1H2JW02_9BACT|nr:Acyltransferase family protein [Desulfobacula phenolica]